MMSDDRRSQHSVGHPRSPVLFADDVALKPSPLTYPSLVLKAACLSGRHRLGMRY